MCAFVITIVESGIVCSAIQDIYLFHVLVVSTLINRLNYNVLSTERYTIE